MKTVLLVDDDDSIRAFLSLYLQRMGFSVVEAPNGEAALEQLEVNNISLVVTDYLMPGLNGVDVTRRVHEKFPRMPVVIITAHKDKVAADSGATLVIEKPIRYETLKASLTPWT